MATSTTAIAKAITVRNNRGLYDQDIMNACPAVFAAAPHESRSQRYSYIPTQEILGAMRQEGFWPVEVMQSGTRIEGKRGFTKHLIRLRHSDNLGVNGSEVFEMVLVNSHDGTSTYQLMGGVFRFICSNGLIKADFTDRIRVQHSGRNEMQELINAAYKISEEGPLMLQSLNEMKHIELSQDERMLFAKYALMARYNIKDDDKDEDESNVVESTATALPMTSPVTIFQPQDMLRIHRSADAGKDLFTTLNVVQENAIKGGPKRNDNKGKRHSIRQVKNINQTLKVNGLVYQFAEELKKLHN